jgi:hypothetical protein
MSKSMRSRLIVVAFILIIAANSYYLITHNYSFGSYRYGQSLKDKIEIAKTIVNQTDGREFSLRGKGPGSQFASFTMNYEYLLWWLGHRSSQHAQQVVEISDNPKEIKIIGK